MKRAQILQTIRAQINKATFLVNQAKLKRRKWTQKLVKMKYPLNYPLK